MNLALEKPVQMDTIDLLFFELLSFFRQHKEGVDNDKLLKEKDEDISSLLQINHRMSKFYKKNILFTHWYSRPAWSNRLFIFMALKLYNSLTREIENSYHLSKVRSAYILADLLSTTILT